MADDLIIRSACEAEYLEVHGFVSLCKPLEPYGEHFFKIMLRYFGNTCYIAEQEGRIVGWVMGFFSQKQTGTYFLWQIGVHPENRGQRLGQQLLKHLEKHLRNTDACRIELTIDPENVASRQLFENNGYENISSREGPIIQSNGRDAVKDYYKPGRHFMLYEKALLERAAKKDSSE